MNASPGLDACEQLAAVKSKSGRQFGHTDEVGPGLAQVKDARPVERLGALKLGPRSGLVRGGSLEAMA